MKKDVQEEVIIRPKNCPICKRATIYASNIVEDNNVSQGCIWYKCSCGIIFQSECPERIIKDRKYIDNHLAIKEYDDVSIHAPRTYGNFIEEMTYGRKMLDVGFCTDNVMNFMKKRGWITFGIDNNESIQESDRIIKDDFENTNRLYEKTYDLVWMSFVLEKFKDPLKALMIAKEILQEDGVLYIATPDIDFLYNRPYAWPHWNRKENYILWSIRALERELQKMGFEVKLKQRNFASRFGYDHNIHMIAQKVYY